MQCPLRLRYVTYFEINQGSCGFCTRLQNELLNTAAGFNYDVPVPVVSDAGWGLTCDCILGTRAVLYAVRKAAEAYIGPATRSHIAGPATRNYKSDFTANIFVFGRLLPLILNLIKVF